MAQSFQNWLIIYPHDNNDVIKKLIDLLKLQDFTISIIIVDDYLSKKQVAEYVQYVNSNIKYSGLIASCPAKKTLETMEGLSATERDCLFILRDGKIRKERVRF